jgi:uncharacterized protein YggE
MFMLRTIWLTFILSVCAVAQIDSNSITVTATRNASGPPDQAVVSVAVSSGYGVNLSDVLAAVQPVGLTVANFTGLNSTPILNPFPGPIPAPAPAVNWSFRLLAPLNKLKDTLAALATLQQNIGKNNSGLGLQFAVQGTQSSQTQPCSPTDLMTDARAQAQKLADASGLTLSNVLALSGSTGPTPVCASTVKFGVTRFQ